MNTRFMRFALAIGLGLGCSITLAQPSERAYELLDKLDAPSWQERDQATNDLVDLAQEISFDQLGMLLSDTTRSIEQRTRLLVAITARFVDEPKGGLGVAFGNIRVGAIELNPITKDPKFPASAILNPGDAIAMIDNEIVTNAFELRAQILSRSPGDILPATLIRANNMIRLELPLGSYRDLAGAALLDPALARRSLELRLARRGIVLPEPDIIGSNIAIDQWRSAAFPSGAPPDPGTDTRWFAGAITAGPGRLDLSSNAPNRLTNRTWTSPERITQRQIEIQIQTIRRTSSDLVAERSVLGQRRGMLEDEQSQAKDPDRARALTAQIGEIQAALHSIETRLEKLDLRIKRVSARLKAD